MAYEVMVLDVDGTLIGSDKKMSEATRTALLGIQEQGVKIVIASGRSTAGILPIANELKLDLYGGYILSYNGGMATNCATGSVLYSINLPRKIIPEIYKFSQTHQTGIMTYHNNKIIAGNHADKYIQIDAEACGIEIHIVSDFTKEVVYPVNKCLLTGESDYLEKVEPLAAEAFQGRLSVYRSEGFYIEMMPLGIDKGYGTSKILKTLGFSRHQTIACGDGYNDTPMIEYAGLGVAMGNANEHLKSRANYIAPSHDEDGLVDVIEKFVKEQ